MSRKPIERDRSRLDFGSDDSQTSILHIDMDAFYASVELIERPELVGKPVIIGGSGGRGVVLSATYEARALGVHAAMPMSAAKRLAPQATVISPSHHKYSEVSDAVMEIFSDVTPEVEAISLDEAFLDVSGARRRLGTPTFIGEYIRARIEEEQKITCSVGIAANKFVAKLASTAIKPNGCLVVPPARVIDFLHPLPVGALWGVGPKTEEQLLRLGLRSVADVANTPVSTLERALGFGLAHHLSELSWGRDDRLVISESREKSISNEVTFSTDIDAHEELLKQLLELSEQVAKRLREQGLAGYTITLKLRYSDFKTITRSQKQDRAVDTAFEIYGSIKRLFEELRLQRVRVRLVGVKVDGLIESSEVWAQLDLGLPEVAWQKAERAMDKASDRFGQGAVRPARLVPTDDN
ncbi:MAG: DNA polymerase IV [Actinobacteria bacterium]|nr:DNA polymerase IV [Actinomycetota bacterium]